MEAPQMMHMMGSGMGGETMVDGKNPTCTLHGSMGPKKDPTCSHHVEANITKNGQIDTKAMVSITLTNTRTHRAITVPIMYMFGKDVRDHHYGNNVHAPPVPIP